MRLGRALALITATLWLGACDQHSGASIAWNTFWDTLSGPPDEAELKRRAHFEGAGVSFDYPEVLRQRHEVDDDGDTTWSFEHGMFELELYAPKAELRAADYLGILGEIFDDGRSSEAEPLTAGRSANLCGHTLTATRLRLQLMGDWSEIEGFDLPAPAGESRILVFDDEPVEGQPSAVAQATYAQVLGSVRCDPSFALRVE